jgi:5-methylcytosine-specific restriction enzyme subunit McrC
MTENYRSIVDLSLSILAQRPRLPSSGGEGKAFGVLLDMAEIWELYVAKFLQIGLPELRVSHTGRMTKHLRWLLRNSLDEDKLGSLRPDIVISDYADRCVAIVDAKYKTSRINVVNRTGVATDDLYQLAAYLSGFGEPMSRLDGFLIYPDDEDGQVAQRLAPKNPWTFASAPQRRLWFVQAICPSFQLSAFRLRSFF